MENNERRYKKQCPFCKAIVEGFKGGNLFCDCNAKYYWESDIWLDRNTGKEVKGDLWNKTY